MSVPVKICGLSDPEGVDACIAFGARFLGFVFCPQSRRCIAPTDAASLAVRIPPTATSVGLFVNPSDEDIASVLRVVPLGMIQLHGLETSERVAEIKRMTHLPIIKAVGIAATQDVLAARRYEDVADFLLLDAKAGDNEISGGKGVVFDWSALKNSMLTKPWFLAGGLNEANLGDAIAKTGAPYVDVSSGVENANGRKSPEKIRRFLQLAHTLETCY